MKRAAAAFAVAVALIGIPAASASTYTPDRVEAAITRTVDRLQERTGVPCTVGFERTAPNRWRIDLRCYPAGRTAP